MDARYENAPPDLFRAMQVAEINSRAIPPLDLYVIAAFDVITHAWSVRSPGRGAEYGTLEAAEKAARGLPKRWTRKLVFRLQPAATP